MDLRNRYYRSPNTNLIRVNFRKDALLIDSDPYLARVTEIHCRLCCRSRPRAGATDLENTWGYVCEKCMKKLREGEPRPDVSRSLTAIFPARESR